MSESINSSVPLADVVVSRVTEYTPEIAAGLGALLPQVWDGYSGDPMPQEDLDFIIKSTEREQIVATRLGEVVGMTTVVIHASPSGKEVWMNDFITSPDPEIRGHGVGRMLFDEALLWANEQGMNLAFTSMDPKVHPIYKALGATPDYTTTRFSAISKS